MASKDEQKKKGMPTWATALIVMVILAIVGAVGYYFYSNKGSANTNAGRNIGTPAPVGNAAVMSMPSPTNVSAGNGNGAGNNASAGRVGAQV